MKNIMLIVVILMLCLTEVTLTYYYPKARTDFDVWLEYFWRKDAAYDLMFFLMLLVVFLVTKESTKAIAACGVVIAGGSLIDKGIFQLNQYLYSDVILILVSIVVGAVVYKREKRHGRPKDLDN